MSTITWPSGLTPRQFSLRLAPVQRTHSSPFGGSEQVVDLLNDRWMVSMELPADTHANMAAVEAFIAAMRGQTNTVALYHWARQAVRGTLASGTATGSIGASSITVSGSGTLKAGDMIGAGGLLLQVAADVTLSGSGSVSLVNRLRTALSSAALTLTQPTAPFRLINQPAVPYVASFTDTVTLEFAEAI